MAIYDDLRTAARDCPDQVALEFAGRAISYRQLHDDACGVAAGLQRRGVPQGAPIGIMLPNIPQFLSVAFGGFFSGCVVTPMSVLLTPREVRHLVCDSAIAVLFVHASLLPVVDQALAGLAPAPQVVVIGAPAGADRGFEDFVADAGAAVFAPIRPDQHMLTLYTSGTTGPSKGVMISDANMCAQIAMFGTAFRPEAGARALCVLPLFHAYALNAVISMAIRYRVTVVLHERFVVETCADSLAHDRIEWFAGVPTMYALLLDHGEVRPDLAFEHLRICLTGGAAMNSDVLARFEARFGVPILEGYGLTETTVSLCSNAMPASNRRIGSVGRPYAGVECRVVDDQGRDLPTGQVGELWFRGCNVMLGYLNRPDDTAQVLAQGWLRSGDLGRLDADGFCYIVGRKKDLIIKSGYNIVPLEVEEAIRTSDLVKDACVVGIPDPVRGERILAAIILTHPGAEDEARRQIAQTLGALLSKYKHPNELWFVDQFPLGPSGKVLKTAIRQSWLQLQTDKENDDARLTA